MTTPNFYQMHTICSKFTLFLHLGEPRLWYGNLREEDDWLEPVISGLSRFIIADRHPIQDEHWSWHLLVYHWSGGTNSTSGCSCIVPTRTWVHSTPQPSIIPWRFMRSVVYLLVGYRIQLCSQRFEEKSSGLVVFNSWNDLFLWRRKIFSQWSHNVTFHTPQLFFLCSFPNSVSLFWLSFAESFSVFVLRFNTGRISDLVMLGISFC